MLDLATDENRDSVNQAGQKRKPVNYLSALIMPVSSNKNELHFSGVIETSNQVTFMWCFMICIPPFEKSRYFSILFLYVENKSPPAIDNCPFCMRKLRPAGKSGVGK